ncbi:complement factor H, partial [Amblyraja radiata]|uniref:complement factor H n=1 Tax=Amblyraja radiata TaxID=386614 RepID=UPI00140253E6
MELAHVVILLGIFNSFITLSLCESECSPPQHIENADPILRTRMDSYPHRTEITYRCDPGYVGFLRYWCKQGVWRKAESSTECRLKSCGSPGDILHGSFQLVRGTDLVFGSRIEYKCNEGYQLVGTRNYSICEVSGWSGLVRHCEVNKCPPVRKPENGKIAGFDVLDLNQDYPYGTILNFECNTPDLIIDGAKEIYCMKNKTWSQTVPKCIELRCNKPDLENGEVQTTKESFKSLERLHYRCNYGYKSGGELVTTCTQFGWSPVPSCTPILCRKVTIEHGQFDGTNRMYPNLETVKYTCNENYVHRGVDTISCTAQGWQPNPSCTEISCPRPHRDPQLNPNKWRYKLQEEVVYRCINQGWSQRSRCTRNGWHPAIICRSDPCQRPEINNAVPSRKHRFQNGETLQVRCSRGYKLQGDAGIKCTDGEWQIERSFPACIEPGCVKPPTIENGDFRPKKARYDQDEVVGYTCVEGYYRFGESSLRCGSIGWPDPPKCIDMQSACMDPYPLVEHGFIITETSYKLNYECHAGYNMEGSEVVICTDGKWSQPPTCSAPPDPKQGCKEMPPPLKDGDFLGFDFPPFRPGQNVTYQCQDYYILDGNKHVTCSGGKWSKSPRCLEPCILTQEDFDKNSLTLKWKIQKRIDVKHGDVLEFKCPRGLQMEPPGKQFCKNGKMEIPKCINHQTARCETLDSFNCPTCTNSNICFQYDTEHITMTRPDQSSVIFVASTKVDASFTVKVDSLQNKNTFGFSIKESTNARMNIRFGTNPEGIKYEQLV